MDSSYDDQNRASIEVKVLRSLANLCGGTSAPEYMAACAQLHFFYNHFSRPSMILELEQEERAALFPKSTLLAIGRSPIINFNWEPDYQRSSSTEDRASRQHPHALKDPLQPLSLNSIPLESFAAALWSLSQFRTGHGLVRMCHKYEFLPHVVYSLMTGRPTIIYGPVRCKRKGAAAGARVLHLRPGGVQLGQAHRGVAHAARAADRAVDAQARGAAQAAEEPGLGLGLG